MSKYTPVLEEFLKQQEWTTGNIVTSDSGEESQYRSHLVIADQSCRFYIDLDDQRDLMMVTIYLPFKAPGPRRSEMCVLLNSINRMGATGRIELDPEDGELRYQVKIDLEGCEPTAVFLNNLVRYGVMQLETRMNCIAVLVFSDLSASEIEAAYREANNDVAPGRDYSDKPPEDKVVH